MIQVTIWREVTQWHSHGDITINSVIGNVIIIIIIIIIQQAVQLSKQAVNIGCYSSVIFVNENENENGEKWENNEFVNEN